MALLILGWHKWHMHMNTDTQANTMWSTYAMEPRLYMLPIETGLPLGRLSQCRCVSVYLSEGATSVCLSSDTGESCCCCHTQPGGGDRGQRDTEGEKAKGLTAIKLPSRKSWGLVAEGFLWSQLWSTGENNNNVFSHPSTDPWIY